MPLFTSSPCTPEALATSEEEESAAGDRDGFDLFPGLGEERGGGERRGRRLRLLQCALEVMQEEWREAGDEEAAKEMEEEGEKWTCCFPWGVLCLKEEEQEEDVLLPRSAAWSYQPGMVGKRRHDRGVPLALKEPSDLLRRMLHSMGAPGDAVVRNVFHSASALSTIVLEPSATMDETKAVASSSQLPTFAAGEGSATRRRAVGAGGVRCAACMVSLSTVFGKG